MATMVDIEISRWLKIDAQLCIVLKPSFIIETNILCVWDTFISLGIGQTIVNQLYSTSL